MAHITTDVEYALHCLLFLIKPRADAHQASARDLAELQGVPLQFVAKLFT
ncbi:MAG: RrF2 family transcriptional regulator, partial [Candidatus Binataceae bacterium]